MKFILVPFLIPDFSLLRSKLEHFPFKVLYWIILYWYIDIILEQIMKKNYNTLTVPYEKSKMVSFASSVMKKMVKVIII